MVGSNRIHAALAALAATAALALLPAGAAAAGTPPVVEDQWVSGVSASGATLNATIDPRESDTLYHFEYDTAAYSGAAAHGSSAPAPDADIGAGTPVSVSVHVQGLAPATVYRFRVVARNAAGETAYGQDGAFTTQGPGGGLALPDGRAYELVSPVEKNAGVVLEKSRELDQAAPSDGESAIAYGSYTTFGQAQAAPLLNHYIATRTPTGWSTSAIDPATPALAASQTLGTPRFLLFSEDLVQAIYWTYNPVEGIGAGEPEQQANLYLRGSSGAYTLLTGAVNPSDEEASLGGASADLSHVAFAFYGKLTPNATAGQQNLYEWVDGAVHLVNVLPNGEVDNGLTATGSGFGSHVYTPQNFWAGENLRHAVSSDGRRVYWTDADHGAPGNPAGWILYLREAGAEGERTVQVDESRGPDASGGGVLQHASADGSVAYFVDLRRLTSEAHKQDEKGGCYATNNSRSGDLYRYEVQPDGPGRLSDLTAADPRGGCVQAVVGGSADGSVVYFVAWGALVAGAQRGAFNLYVSEPDPEHAGQRRTRLVAVLRFPEDSGDWEAFDSEEAKRTVAVTSDGMTFAFDSAARLTSYDNRGASEVYLYEAAPGRLRCVSCNPTGAAPLGPATIEPGYTELYAPRVIAAGGKRVFFESSDALVPQDTNGRQDVYEWEAGGEGSCQVPAGCMYLLSGGTNSEPSTFVDATPSGDNAYFTTAEQLVVQDTDTSTDLYDARAGGGFAAPASLACTGSGCQGVASAPPIFATPATVTFAGAGNAPAPAARAAVKRKPKHKARRRRAPKRKRARHARRAGHASRRSGR